MTTPPAPDADEDLEHLDDPDLEAALDEPATESADEVMAAMRAMLEAYRRAVA